MATKVIGLDGAEREWDEVFTGLGGIDHGHGLSTNCGYVVRRTFFDERAHEDVARFDEATSYGEAIELARQVRADNDGGYAVVDTIHSCGCRTNG